jgi:hypothetical protein
MIKEPKRLSRSSDELGASVSALSGTLPSEDRLAALAARLTEAGAGMDDPTSGVIPKPAVSPSLDVLSAPSWWNTGTLAVILALVAGGALVTTAVLIRQADVPLVPATAAPVTAAPQHGETQPVAPERPAAREVAPGGMRPGSGAAPSPLAPREPARLELAPTAPAAPQADVSAPVEPKPAAASATTPAVAAQAARPAEPESTRRARPGTKMEAGPSSDGAPLAENTVVESEIELLKRAKSALMADPLQAFALTERCRAQYGGGSFAQEREYIAISALSRLGRGAEARSRASLFRLHYPNSAYLPRLAPLLGE